MILTIQQKGCKIKDKIEEKIKERYDSKALFCKENGYNFKNLAQRVNSLENRIEQINDFLKPLNLQVTIQEREEKKQG